MDASNQQFAKDIAAAADAGIKADEIVEVYPFIKQVGTLIERMSEPSQISQSAKGIVSGQLVSLKQDHIPYAQLEASRLSLTRKLEMLESKHRNPAEEVDLKALTVALSGWHAAVAAGIRNQSLEGLRPKRITAAATEAIPQMPAKLLPLKSGNIRTTKLTLAIHRLSAEAGLDKEHTNILVDAFLESVRVTDIAEMTIAHFKSILEKFERHSDHGDAGKRPMYHALHDMLQQAIYDLRETENVGTVADNVVDGAYKQAARRFANIELAAEDTPHSPKVTPQEPKPVLTSNQELVRRAAASLAEMHQDEPTPQRNGGLRIGFPPHQQSPQPVKPLLVTGAAAPSPVVLPMHAPTIIVELPQATPTTKPVPVLEGLHPNENEEPVSQTPSTTVSATRERSQQPAITKPTTFKKALADMNAWLNSHEVDIDVLKHPKKLQLTTPAQLQHQLIPLRNAIEHSHGKVAGRKLLDNLMSTHETLYHRSSQPAAGTLWGNGGVVKGR